MASKYWNPFDRDNEDRYYEIREDTDWNHEKTKKAVIWCNAYEDGKFQGMSEQEARAHADRYSDMGPLLKFYGGDDGPSGSDDSKGGNGGGDGRDDSPPPFGPSGGGAEPAAQNYNTRIVAPNESNRSDRAPLRNASRSRSTRSGRSGDTSHASQQLEQGSGRTDDRARPARQPRMIESGSATGCNGDSEMEDNYIPPDQRLPWEQADYQGRDREHAAAPRVRRR